MTYTFDDTIISDLHKDARGYRPSQDFWEGWNTMGDDTKQSVWDMLIEELNSKMEMQRVEEENALNEFRTNLRKVMNYLSGCTWTRALEILAEEEEIDISCDQYFDYFLWNQGVGFEDRKNIRQLYQEAA